MTMIPIKDMNENKILRKYLKNMFDSERSGDQTFLREQTRTFEPILNVQKETSKAIKDNIVSNKEATSNTLMPLIHEMQRRNDQIDELASQPFYQTQIEQPEIQPAIQSKPKKSSINVDHNLGLDDSDLQNLKDMSFESPNELHNKFLEFETKQEMQNEMDLIESKVVKKKNSLKILRTSTKSKKEGLADMYNSQYQTLEKYIDKLDHLAKNMGVIVSSTPTKRTGEGIKKKKNVEVIICSNSDDLYLELEKFCAAKEAGHSGVDNHIIAILDKLLKDKYIDMDDYNDFYKNIF